MKNSIQVLAEQSNKKDGCWLFAVLSIDCQNAVRVLHNRFILQRPANSISLRAEWETASSF